MTHVKILYAGMHTGDPNMAKSLRYIEGLDPTSVGLTEMSRLSDRALMRSILKDSYRVVNPIAGDYSTEIPILLKRAPGIHPHRQTIVQLSTQHPGGEHNGLGHPRWQRERTWKQGGETFNHIHTHWNAAIQAKETGERLNVRRAMAMGRAAVYLEEAIQRSQALGWITFVTGDFNWVSTRPKAHKWVNSPDAIAKRNELSVIDVHLDRLMYDSKTVKLIASRIIPPRINLQDHNWIQGRFEVR